MIARQTSHIDAQASIDRLALERPRKLDSRQLRSTGTMKLRLTKIVFALLLVPLRSRGGVMARQQLDAPFETKLRHTPRNQGTSSKSAPKSPVQVTGVDLIRGSGSASSSVLQSGDMDRPRPVVTGAARATVGLLRNGAPFIQCVAAQLELAKALKKDVMVLRINAFEKIDVELSDAREQFIEEPSASGAQLHMDFAPIVGIPASFDQLLLCEASQAP